MGLAVRGEVHERIKLAIVDAWPEARRVRRNQVDEY
jgi:hypothetical protein